MSTPSDAPAEEALLFRAKLNDQLQRHAPMLDAMKQLATVKR